MSNKYIEISRVKLSTLNKNGKTILDDVYCTSPFKVVSPFYIRDNFIKVIIMSSSAGTMEGDAQCYDINLEDNTNMEVTSQSYEKIHTMTEEDAYRECNIYIGSNSLLKYNLLPTIPYKDSAFRSVNTIKLKDNSSKLIYMDMINCGRVAHGEKFQYKYYKSYTEIKCEDKIIYLDNTCFVPSEMNMNSFGMFENYTHFANMILINIIKDDSTIDKIREILENEKVEGGVSLSENNDIIIKMLGYSADKLIKTCESISNLFTNNI